MQITTFEEEPPSSARGLLPQTPRKAKTPKKISSEKVNVAHTSRERRLRVLVSELSLMDSGWRQRVRSVALSWVEGLRLLLKSISQKKKIPGYVSSLVSKMKPLSSASFTVLSILNAVFELDLSPLSISDKQIQNQLLKSKLVGVLLKHASRTKKDWSVALSLSLLSHLLRGPNLRTQT